MIRSMLLFVLCVRTIGIVAAGGGEYDTASYSSRVIGQWAESKMYAQHRPSV